MSRDLEQMAANMVEDIVRDMTTLDVDAIRDEISGRSRDAADNACIYYLDCADIISRYESDPRADPDSADDSGATFEPSEYQQAMAAYAYYIARSIIEAEAYDIAEKIEEAGDTLADELLQHLAQPPSSSDYMLSVDCPHGWAAHDRETDEGACLWLSGQVDGLNAIAVPAGPVWVSYTWEAGR